MHDSHSPFDDSLLSAYVDGELTADERAAVERHLAEHPDARRLVVELREMSELVRALPKETRTVDLAQRVSQRITQREGNTVAAPGWSIGRSSRGWVWGAMAIAAALLMTVFTRPDDEPRNVAAVDNTPAAERPSDRRMVLTAPEAAAPVPPAPAMAPASAPLAEALPALEETENMVAEGALAERRSETDSVARSGGTELSFNTPRPASPDVGLDAEAPLSRSLGDVGVTPVVVEVRATRFAIDNREFDKVLDSRGIALVEEPPLAVAGTTVSGRTMGRDGTAVPESLADKPAESAADGFGGGVGGGFDDATARKSKAYVADEAILVEASPAQLQQTLTDLSNNTAYFRDVTVDAGQVAEPVRSQLKVPTQKLSNAKDVQDWIDVNREALSNYGKQLVVAQQATTEQTELGTAGEPPVTESEASKMGVEFQQVPPPLQQSRAQVLYSNNRFRAKSEVADELKTANGPTGDTAEEGEVLARQQSIDSNELWRFYNFVPEDQQALARQQAAAGDSVRILFLLRAEPELAAAEATSEAAASPEVAAPQE